MKKYYIVTILTLFLSVTLSAQEYKWSVEANFPISVGDEIGNDAPGIIDVGLKYRFLDFKIVKIGAVLNAGVFQKNIKDYTIPESTNFDETNWVIQPKLFAEFTIPGVNKLHPSIGLGYTIVQSKDKGLFIDEPINASGSNGGINLNLGLSYDITNRFFIQAQYDYVRTKDDFDFLGNTITVKQNLGYLKAGIGFRF